MTETKQYSRNEFLHRYYAHRGLHNAERGCPENSLAAFRAAAEKGYGVELDVQLSQDGQVIVFHDDTLDRVCGVHGNVADYPLSRLREMRLLQTTETIPLLTEVLDVLSGRAGPLIVELKTGRHNQELCAKTLALLRHYPGVFCIESFDPRIVRWFRKNAPEIFRGQLAQPASFYLPLFSKSVARLLAGCRFSFLNRPDFIAWRIGPVSRRIHRLCHGNRLLIGWTSHQAEQDAPGYDSIIFESCFPPLKYDPSATEG